MAASGRSAFQGGELPLKLTVYAWVPSQEELHSLWRADDPQTNPPPKKNYGGGDGVDAGAWRHGRGRHAQLREIPLRLVGASMVS